jgi:hypothetical protein
MNQPEISLIVSCSVIPTQVKTFLDRIVETQPVSKIELLLVVWNGCDYLPLVTAPFGAKYQVNFDPQTGLNEARAKAVGMATTDIVVFLEDHTRVEGPWVDELIRLFSQGEYAAIGWTTKPGNMASKVSWAGYLVEYGYWGPGVEQGQKKDILPGHNCAYTRETLLHQHEQLPFLLLSEAILHWRLLREGKKLFFTTDVTLFHYQFLSLSKFLKANFWYGWSFANTRQKVNGWGILRRGFYALAILLKPLVRWKVLLSTPRDKTFFPAGIVWKCSLNITLVYFIASIGEAMGHIFGAWKSPVFLTRYEVGFDRSQP